MDTLSASTTGPNGYLDDTKKVRRKPKKELPANENKSPTAALSENFNSKERARLKEQIIETPDLIHYVQRLEEEVVRERVKLMSQRKAHAQLLSSLALYLDSKGVASSKIHQYIRSIKSGLSEQLIKQEDNDEKNFRWDKSNVQDSNLQKNNDQGVICCEAKLAKFGQMQRQLTTSKQLVSNRDFKNEEVKARKRIKLNQIQDEDKAQAIKYQNAASQLGFALQTHLQLNPDHILKQLLAAQQSQLFYSQSQVDGNSVLGTIHPK